MKPATLFLLAVFSTASLAQVFRCDEPKGTALWSVENHKPGADGFTGVKPVVIVGDKEMTIIWGDAKSAGGAEKVWKATIINRAPWSISAVAVDIGDAGSVVMLFTMNLKRRFIYMSTHKESATLNASGASTFVSTCGN